MAAELSQGPQQSQALTTSARMAYVGNWLLFIGQLVIVTTKDPWDILNAVYVKLYAGFLFLIAALLEADETVRGLNLSRITFTGEEKIIGASISLIGAIILTGVLQTETLEKPTTTGVSPFIPGAAGIGT